MRKFVLALAAATVALSAISLTNRADAMSIGGQIGLITAIEDLAVVDQIHCRPFRRHHVPTQTRRADGCRRWGWRSKRVR